VLVFYEQTLEEKIEMPEHMQRQTDDLSDPNFDIMWCEMHKEYYRQLEHSCFKKPSQDPTQLLAEWFRWWSNSDTAPSKMPNSLHTRTVVYLCETDAIGYIALPSSLPGVSSQ